jgi:hypothetical protein
MLPREDGGVVDNKLKVSFVALRGYGPILIRCYHLVQVYGTTNIRVMDLSIVPLHFAAHTQGER